MSSDTLPGRNADEQQLAGKTRQVQSYVISGDYGPADSTPSARRPDGEGKEKRTQLCTERLEATHLVVVAADAGEYDVILLTALEAVHRRHLYLPVQRLPQRTHLPKDDG